MHLQACIDLQIVSKNVCCFERFVIVSASVIPAALCVYIYTILLDQPALTRLLLKCP